MSDDSNPRVHLRFAIGSLILIAVVAATLILVLAQLVRTSTEDAAVEETNALVSGPIQGLLKSSDGAPQSSAALSLRAAAAVPPLIAGDIRAVRMWSPDGGLLYGADGGRALKAGTSERRTGADGKSVLATYFDAGTYVIEVDRDASAIDASVASLRTKMILSVLAIAALAYALAQIVFRAVFSQFFTDHHRLRYFYTTGQKMRSSLDLHDVISQVARDGTRLANAQHALVALFEHETGDLILRATHQRETDVTSQHHRPIDEWFLRRCVATRTTLTSKEPGAAYKQVFGKDLALDGDASLLCVPMYVHDRVIGAVAIIRSASQQTEFGPSEIRGVEELAGQAVMAVEQALLFAKVRSYADELETSYDTTLKVLMAALDTKDDATEGHCDRVAKLTSQLARSMDVPAAALVDMERGALLHDVGKIGVPDAVLKKPRALNELEWEAMRKHPLLAGVMVSKVGFLEGALPILLYHHERYDGLGYPFGLEGDKIPIDARIFSIVDSYDAMTSNRPYRDAMGHDAAMHEIHENSGTQFDPDVVRAFEKLMASRPDLHVRVPNPISDEHVDHDYERELPSSETESAA